MKRLAAGAVTLALGALLAAGTASAGTPSGGQSSLSPRAQLTGFSCHRALDPASRSISVTAVMRPLTGTQHLALRFDLLSTSPLTGITTAVHFGDLGTWKTAEQPNPRSAARRCLECAESVDRARRSGELPVSGHVPLDGSRRTRDRHRGQAQLQVPPARVASRPAGQLDQRSPISGDPADDLYTAVIANDGASGAGPFEVLFAPADGSAPKTRTVQLLRAHTSTMLSFVGPVCDRSTDPTVTVDSTDPEVDDLNRANNSSDRHLPGPSYAGTSAGDRLARLS